MKISEMILKIWENQEDIKSDVSEIKVNLAEQNAILEEHQRRSIANEEAVAILREHMKPIEDHVLKVNFFFKLRVAAGGVVGVVAAIVKIVDFFLKH